MFTFFLLFLFAHALTDWCWQPDVMGICKRPMLRREYSDYLEIECKSASEYLAPYVNLQIKIPWWYWLTAHAFAQGAGVFGVCLLTEMLKKFPIGQIDIGICIILAVAEIAVHWIIDLGKCLNYYGIHVDQGLHLFSKLVWAGLIYAT